MSEMSGGSEERRSGLKVQEGSSVGDEEMRRSSITEVESVEEARKR